MPPSAVPAIKTPVNGKIARMAPSNLEKEDRAALHRERRIAARMAMLLLTDNRRNGR
jgi:hypothetical protein